MVFFNFNIMTLFLLFHSMIILKLNIILGRCKMKGINCWLKDENTATITPFFSNAVGGIKLMVGESQVERATELLSLFNNNARRNEYACLYS